MDLTALRTALSSRGFSYLSSSRLDQFINQAYWELCDEENWSFLEASSSGASPLTISDLGQIESVVDSTNEIRLAPWDRSLVQDLDPSLDDTGNPPFYYVSGGDTVTTWPTTSVTIAVRYWRDVDALSAVTDEPVVPDRYQYLIVDGAARRAYQDDDKPDLAAMAENEYQRGLTAMRDALLALPATDGAGWVALRSGAGDW